MLDGFCHDRRLMLPGLPHTDNETQEFAVQGKEYFMIKKILCVFMVFVLIFSLGACKKNNDKVPTASGATTVAGQTEETADSETEIVTGENGEPVTDENGKPIVTDTTQASPLISDETMPTGKTVEVSTTTDGKPTNSLIDSSLSDIFKGGKYSIKFDAQIETDGVKQKMPAAIYVSGKKSLIELTIGDAGLGLGMGLGKMAVLNNGTEKYLLIDLLKLLKGYVPIPAGEAGGYDDMFNFSGFAPTSDLTYVKTTKVTYKGVEYISEEYRGSDATIKYFFNDGKLKRIEQVSDDGSKVFMENIVITDKFNESVFNIPAGYKQISEKDLEGLSGLLG